MHKLISIIFLFSVCGVFSQSIENVDFRAEGKTIVVTYDFFHSKSDTAINVELVFKDQQGGVVTPKTITGDIKNVKPGESKRIVWDVLSDGISLSGKYKAEVSIKKNTPVIIENVDFRAEGKTIVVTYDFFHSKADTAIKVELVFKDEQGGVVTPKTITGDIKNVKPGESKRIVWDALSDGINLSGKYEAEVSIQKNTPVINLKSVLIGEQSWTNENLNVDYFRNGDIIPEAKTAEEWINAGKNKQAAWCYYNNDPNNEAKYGKLYNWHAVNDKRGLAPNGWHVPTDAEWTILSDFLGGENQAGTKMKSTSGWNYGGAGTNSNGFAGLPGGYRYSNGDFYYFGRYGFWWSASENSESSAWYRGLYSSYSDLNRNDYYKSDGFSVRCVRD